MNHPVSSGSHDISELWQRFESWLRSNTPGDYAALRPGASDAEIARVESRIGFPLDRALKSLLASHNGVLQRRSSMEPGAFFLGYSLLDTELILESQQYLSSMAHEAAEEGDEELVVGSIAHSQWVPFAQGITGDLLFVDHRSDHHGDVGEISFGDPEYRWLWPGLGLMLHDLCTAVENMSRRTTRRRAPPDARRGPAPQPF